MRLARRWMSLSSADRGLVWQALRAVIVVRAGLWMVPVARLMGTVSARGKGGAVEKSVWAVRAAARVVPGATCLTQAIALQRLLAQGGLEAKVEIGVAKGEAGFEAHAWVEYEGRVLIGGGEAGRFVPLRGR